MTSKLRLGILVIITLAVIPAFAEVSEGMSRAGGWTWPASIIAPLVATAVLYAIGISRSWHRQKGSRMRLLPVVCFATGWLSLLVALDSPVHEISEQLFWVHMTQHEILILISAPLMVLGQPLAPLLLGLPERWRRPVGNIGRQRFVRRAWLVISAPFATWLLHGVALWGWHAPRLFDATQKSDWVHAAQHISFLGTGLLFWWTLFHQHAGRLGYGGAILYIFTTAIHTSVLGALLTFAPTAWYAPYAQTAPLWGLTGLQDQQIGGLIMWIPAGTLLTIAGLILLTKWMRHSDTRWEYTRTAALIRASQGAAE